MDGDAELNCAAEKRDTLESNRVDGGGDMAERSRPCVPVESVEIEDKVAANRDEMKAAALLTNPTVVYREFLEVVSAFECLRETEIQKLVQELEDLNKENRGLDRQSALTTDAGLLQPDSDERSGEEDCTGTGTVTQFDETKEKFIYAESVDPEKLDPESIVYIKQLKERPNASFEGKIFICNCVAIPRMIGESFITLVTDQHGEDVVFLESLSIGQVPFGLHDLINLLFRACMILIENPIFTETQNGRYSVAVANITSLKFLTETLFKELLPDFTWTPFDSRPKDVIPVGNDAAELSKQWAYLGSRYFIQKNYMLAIDCYNISIKLNPYDVDVLVHRSAAFTLMGVYSAALTDAQEALNIDPNNLKGINRKTKALIYLRKYDEASKFLVSLLSQPNVGTLNASSKKFIEGLHEQSEALLRQYITGEFNCMEFYKKPGKRADDQAEFIGSVKVCTNSEGRKGVYATNNIKQGELIMAVRAFAAVIPEDGCSSDWSSKINHLAANVIAKVKYDTEDARQQFFELPNGPNIERVDKQVAAEVELFKILNLCEMNGFGMDSKCSDGWEPIEFGKAAFGLWILPSYIRHSCLDANCLWRTCGDFLFVRAICDIATGGELVLPFGDVTASFNVRKKIFDGLGQPQSCGCQLCVVDAKDSAETQHQREEIIQKMTSLMSKSTIDAQVIIDLLSQVAALEGLRSANPKLNFAILEPLQIIGMAYYIQGKHRQAIACFERVFNIVEGTPLIGNLVYVTMNLAVVNAKGGYIRKAKKWAKILKKHLMIGFGCIEVIEIISKDSVKFLKENGIDILSPSS